MDKATVQARIQEVVANAQETMPLAGSITNAVTMNFVANAQLAVGGSAAMVYLADEAEGLVAAGGAFYVNMGTLFPSHLESIPAAARAAAQAGKPLVVDPVGIGLGAIRTQILKDIRDTKPAIVRGNASEIIALAQLWDLKVANTAESRPRGVDSVDAVDDAVQAACAMARFTGGAVAISGETDVVIDGTYLALSHGGSSQMTKVTGMGCSLGGVMAVYVAVGDPFTAALAGAQVYNLAGTRALAWAHGTGSYYTSFVDELSRATPKDIAGNPFEIKEL